MNTENSNYDRIISVATELFLSKGVKSTSIDLIVKESGVSKSNIYYHFKSKDEIILAVVNSHIAWFRIHVLAPIFNNSTVESTLNLIDQYFMGMAQFLESNDCKKGCPFASFIMQVSQTHEKVRLCISDFFTQINQELSALVQAGIDKGEIKKNVGADQTAQFIFSVIEGAMLQAMTHRDVSVIRNSAKVLRRFLQE